MVLILDGRPEIGAQVYGLIFDLLKAFVSIVISHKLDYFLFKRDLFSLHNMFCVAV